MLGIVLGAGIGGRMGGPKARLLIAGETLAALHAQRLREAGCEEVVVVLAQHDAIDATIAISHAPDPAGSLAIGLDAATGDPIIVTPVDVIPAHVETIRALVRALEGHDAVTPRFRGRGGHPVVIRRAAIEIGKPLNGVLERLGERRKWIEIEDAAVVTDLDTPDDVVRATGSPPRFR